MSERKGEKDAWFLALCLDCEPLLPQPFRNESDRGAWVEAHAETGHRVRINPPGKD